MMTDKFQKEMQTKLTKGLLDMIVLDLLDQEPMHGYQLISRIRKSFGVSLGASTVYPFLDRLEKKGYLKSQWNLDSARPQKIFSLTKDGQTVLNFAEGSLNLIRINLTSNKITTEEHTPIMVVH
jgi:PadR family transcriptional regulator PadR